MCLNENESHSGACTRKRPARCAAWHTTAAGWDGNKKRRCGITFKVYKTICIFWHFTYTHSTEHTHLSCEHVRSYAPQYVWSRANYSNSKMIFVPASTSHQFSYANAKSSKPTHTHTYTKYTWRVCRVGPNHIRRRIKSEENATNVSNAYILLLVCMPIYET